MHITFHAVEDIVEKSTCFGKCFFLGLLHLYTNTQTYMFLVKYLAIARCEVMVFTMVKFCAAHKVKLSLPTSPEGETSLTQ